MKKYLEYIDETSHKYWQIEVTGNEHTVTYGKINTEGQSQTKSFSDKAEALKDAEKLVQSKLKKGYEEIEAEKPKEKIEKKGDGSIDLTEKLIEYASGNNSNDFWRLISQYYFSSTEELKKYSTIILDTKVYGKYSAVTTSIASNTKIKWTEDLIQTLYKLFGDGRSRVYFFNSLAENTSIDWSNFDLTKFKEDGIWDYLTEYIKPLLTEEILLTLPNLTLPNQSINWGSVFESPYITWSEGLFDNVYKRFKGTDSDDWGTISCYVPAINIKKYHKQIDWNALSCSNKNLPWSLSFIEENKNSLNWDDLKSNDGIPWDAVLVNTFLKQLKKGDGLEFLSDVKGTIWSIELVDLLTKLKIDIDWWKVSLTNLSWNFIEHFADKLDWRGINQNEKLIWTIELLRKYEDKLYWYNESPTIWELFLKGDENFIEKWAGKNGWDRLSAKAVPWNERLLEKYKNKIDWANMNYSSVAAGSNPDLIIKYMQKIVPKDTIQKIIKTNYKEWDTYQQAFFAEHFPLTDEWFDFVKPLVDWKKGAGVHDKYPWSIPMVESLGVKLDSILENGSSGISDKLFLAHADLWNEALLDKIIERTNGNSKTKTKAKNTNKKSKKSTTENNSISKTYLNKIKEEPLTSVEINLPSGRIMISEYDIKFDYGNFLSDKNVKPGVYKVDVYTIDGYPERLDDYNSTTAGIEMVVVHFSDEKINSWKNVKKAHDPDSDDHEEYDIIDGGDLLDVLICDQSFKKELESNYKDKIEDIKDDMYEDGVTVLEDGKAIHIGIGELSSPNKFYWALNEKEEPVKLVGYFAFMFN